MSAARIRLGGMPIATRQRGQAALLIVVLLVIGISILVYSLVNPAAISITNEKKTAAVLAQAKEALIGHAATHLSKPGILPCPDMDNDGTADAPCGGDYATAIGRLPWKTLGLPDLRDATGNCLWYAVSGNYKNSGPTGESGSTAINPDSLGTLAVHNSDGTLVHAASAVAAIVFSPGLALSGKNRSTVGTTVCGGNTTASNYLDAYTVGATTFNNATGNSFIAAPSVVSLDQLNDQLLPITTEALFNVVNIRVAKEAITALESYRSANPYYPFANAYGSTAPYYCNPGSNRGRFPISTSGGTCGQAPWPANTSAFRTWFLNNDWSLVTHYAVSKWCGQFSLASSVLNLLDLFGFSWVTEPLIRNLCLTAGNLGALSGLIVLLLGGDDPLTVTGVSSNVRVLIIVTGPKRNTQNRPCVDEDQCMEDGSNTDGDVNYVKPSRYTSNDRMAISCATSSPCSVLP